MIRVTTSWNISQTCKLISHFNETAILWDKRLKDNGNKAKTKKAMVPLLARFRNTRPASQELCHRVLSIIKTTTSFWPLSQSFQLLEWPQTPLWRAAIFFPNALPQSKTNLVSDWLKCQFCCRDMLHNRTHDNHGVLRKVQSLRHVPWSWTSWTPCNILQGQILHKFHLHKWKSACAHKRVCHCNMSLKHVLATFSQGYQLWDLVPATCPCYRALQQSSHQCVLNTILFPLHFAVKWCSCNMSPHVGPPLVRGVMSHILRLTIWALYKASCGI